MFLLNIKFLKRGFLHDSKRADTDILDSPSLEESLVGGPLDVPGRLPSDDDDCC